MKIRFKKQQFQTNAVEAVADCFLGQPQISGTQYRLDPGAAPTSRQRSFEAFEEIAGFKNADGHV